MNPQQLQELEVQLNLLNSTTKTIDREIDRLEHMIDRVLTKLSAVITMSGILTFVSLSFASTDLKQGFIKYYLIWIFPYLVVAIGFWIIALKVSRAMVLNYATQIHSADQRVNVQNAQIWAEMTGQVLIRTRTIYDKTNKMFRVSLAAIVVYIAAYVLNFYFFVFSKLFKLLDSVLITIIFVGLGVAFYIWLSSKGSDLQFQAQITIPTEQSPNTAQNTQNQT